MIRGIKSKKLVSSNFKGDLMSILLEAEIYKDEEELIVDDIITFFIAGMRTITTSTTNTIIYLLKDKEGWLPKILDEITPTLKAASNNIQKDLKYDQVMDFNQLMLFYSESLRLEPPVPFSGRQTMAEDCQINDGSNIITFEKGLGYHNVIHTIHNDPKEWPEPHLFKPDRFDFSREGNPWILNSQGKPRNPISF